jgi:hypothetical protein
MGASIRPVSTAKERGVPNLIGEADSKACY